MASLTKANFPRSLCIGLLLWSIGNVLMAQAVLTKGSVRPQAASEWSWFFHTTSHIAFIFKDGSWVPAADGAEVSHISTCGDLVILKIQRANAVEQAVFSKYGERLAAGMDPPTCHGKVVHIDLNYPCFLDARPKAAAQPYLDYFLSAAPQCQAFLTDTVGGKLCFCAVKFHTSMPYAYPCSDLHTWGMLGTNAEWVIPPIFDAPFRFSNGVAEVSYYGKKRRINAKGEFLD